MCSLHHHGISKYWCRGCHPSGNRDDKDPNTRTNPRPNNGANSGSHNNPNTRTNPRPNNVANSGSYNNPNTRTNNGTNPCSHKDSNTRTNNNPYDCSDHCADYRTNNNANIHHTPHNGTNHHDSDICHHAHH